MLLIIYKDYTKILINSQREGFLMGRRLVSILLTVLLCVSVWGICVFHTAAEDNVVNVIIDGQQINFDGDVAPFIENGRTLVPFRKLFEALGLKVSWDDATQTAKGEKEGLVIELTIGSDIAKVNGEEIKLDVPARLVGDRTVVPLRFVSEQSGAKVDWDGETSTVTITTSKKPDPESFDSKIMPVKGGRKGIVTITTDDGMPNSMRVFMDLMEKYDLRASSAMPVKNALPNLDTFRKYVETGRLEIQNHSMTHGPTGNTEEDIPAMEREIIESGKMLRELFPGQEVLCFMWPGGGVEMNEYSLAMVANNYVGARVGTRGFNDINTVDLHAIKVQGFVGSSTTSRNTTLEEAKGWIDTTIEKGYWMVEMWHGFASEDPSSYRPMDKDFADEYFKYVSEKDKAGDIWVAFLGDAVKYIKEYQNAKLINKYATDTTRIIGITDTLEDNELFDYPLTIRSEVAEDWETVNVTQGDRSFDVTAKKEGDKYVIYYDAIPDGGNITLTKK